MKKKVKAPVGGPKLTTDQVKQRLLSEIINLVGQVTTPDQLYTLCTAFSIVSGVV